MTLMDITRALRRRWIIWSVPTILGVILALLYCSLQRPSYSSSAQVFVSVQQTGSASDLSQANSFTQQIVKSYAQVATAPIVLAPVIDNLHLRTTPEALASRVTAVAPLDTVVIDIAATDANPGKAAEISNAVAAQLSQVVGSLTPSSNAASAVRVSIIKPATASTDAVSPRWVLTVALGALGGLFLGLALAFVTEYSDRRIRSAADLAEVTGLPALGAINYDPSFATDPLQALNGSSALHEAYRTIRTNLQFVDIGSNTHSYLISSASASEGKSTTAVNLAITVAAAGRRILLVEADLRRPRLAGYLGLDGSLGLTDLLIGATKVEEVVQRWGDTSLCVLPAGQLPPNPSELLQSERMRQFSEYADEQYDLVIYDAPPVLPVTDAAVLSSLVGGVLLVSSAASTTRDRLSAALDAFARVDARVFGVILSMVPSKGPDAYAYGEYDSRSDSRPRTRSS